MTATRKRELPLHFNGLPVTVVDRAFFGLVLDTGLNEWQLRRLAEFAPQLELMADYLAIWNATQSIARRDSDFESRAEKVRFKDDPLKESR